jgi:hypothetical protein
MIYILSQLPLSVTFRFMIAGTFVVVLENYLLHLTITKQIPITCKSKNNVDLKFQKSKNNVDLKFQK